jgi:hypothetical protein
MTSLLNHPLRKTNSAAVVDPCEPKDIIKAAKAENVTLSGTILTTHHHEGLLLRSPQPRRKEATTKLFYASDLFLFSTKIM